MSRRGPKIVHPDHPLIQSTLPRLSIPLALKDVKSPESSALGLSNVYEYKCLLAYLKVNSRDKDRPLIPFGVSGCVHWTFLIQVVDNTILGKWTFTLDISNTSICTELHWS